MTKLVLAAVAVLSIIASPVLAGPGPIENVPSYDFQMDGR